MYLDWDTSWSASEKVMADTKRKRKYVWIVQTPQVFDTELIKRAYRLLEKEGESAVTDDAMVVETMLGESVKLYEGSYENIKITTPEDLKVAEAFVGK